MRTRLCMSRSSRTSAQDGSKVRESRWLFGERCRCRKLRSRWSGCVVVFVEDAAESITPLDVEVVESRAFGDRWW